MQPLSEDPNKRMFKEMGVGVGTETMTTHLSKEREYERILNQLKKEFSEIDMDKNG